MNTTGTWPPICESGESFLRPARKAVARGRIKFAAQRGHYWQVSGLARPLPRGALGLFGTPLSCYAIASFSRHSPLVPILRLCHTSETPRPASARLELDSARTGQAGNRAVRGPGIWE